MTPEERQEIRERPFHIELDGPFEDGSWAVDINLDEVGHRGLTAGSSIIDAIRNAIESWPDELGSARLLADYDHLVEERDLAIAHDTQPYPTAWAYEQACKARDKWKADYDHLVEVAREVVGYQGMRSPRLIALIDALRALIDPATPEPVEGEPK